MSLMLRMLCLTPLRFLCIVLMYSTCRNILNSLERFGFCCLGYSGLTIISHMSSCRLRFPLMCNSLRPLKMKKHPILNYFSHSSVWLSFFTLISLSASLSVLPQFFCFPSCHLVVLYPTSLISYSLSPFLTPISVSQFPLSPVSLTCLTSLYRCLNPTIICG